MKRWLLAVAVLATTTGAAQAWSVGTITGDRAEIGRITCGLIETYGPSRSYHDLSLAIPDSPYGPLTATMGPSRVLEIGVSTALYPAQPPEATQAEIRRWLVAQLPAKPKPCTFLLASPAWLDRVGYPDVPAMVPEAAYVSIQLDLADQAARLDPDDVWRWSDGALAALRGLDKPARRAFERDPAARAAAYAVVDRPAPAGLTVAGRHGYCDLYAAVKTLFPPRTASERKSLTRARRPLRCR
jgi:hypothetical protein